MATRDTLRGARIPLNNGSGAIPADKATKTPALADGLSWLAWPA